MCNNCKKSKRPCEGYNQRVIFKSNMGPLQGGPFGPLPFHHHPDATEALVNAQLSASQGKASSSSQGPLPIIAPKPPSYEYGNTAHFPYFDPYSSLHRATSSSSLGLGIHQPQYTMSPVSPESYYSQPFLDMTASPTQISQQDLFSFQSSASQYPHANFYVPERRHTAYARVERPFVSPTMPFSPPISQAQSVKREQSEQAEIYAFESGDEEEEELPVNGLSDLEVENPGPLIANNLHAPMDIYGTQVRSFHSLMDGNVLVGYQPSPADTPLNDPKVALVFWYFVTVTAPSLSAYERNRIDPSRIFSGEAIPKSHQHIWSCKSSTSWVNAYILKIDICAQMSSLYKPSSIQLSFRLFWPWEACKWLNLAEARRLLPCGIMASVYGVSLNITGVSPDAHSQRCSQPLSCSLSTKSGSPITISGVHTCLGLVISS